MNCLNKIITLLLIFSFLFCGVALATIEKDTTKKKTQNKQDITPGDSSGNAGLKPNNVPNQKRPSGYDNFIDKNNNGIDDRVEQKTENRKKDNVQDSPNPNSKNSQNQSNKTIRPQQQSNDSVVKLKV